VDIERKLYKADGRGLSLPLNSFFFRIENDNVIFVSESEKKKFSLKDMILTKGINLLYAQWNHIFLKMWR